MVQPFTDINVREIFANHYIFRSFVNIIVLPVNTLKRDNSTGYVPRFRAVTCADVEVYSVIVAPEAVILFKVPRRTA